MKRSIIVQAVLIMLAFSAAPALPADDLIKPPPGTSAKTVNDYNEGIELFAKGQYEAAADKYSLAAKDAPKFEEAHEMYAMCLLKMGKSEQALEALRKAEALKPDKDILLLNMGSTYQNLGQVSKALEKFQRYLKLYPHGEHAVAIKGAIDMLQTEQARSKGIPSSKGQDNFLEEALQVGAARWKSSQMPIPVYIVNGEGLKGYRDSYPELLKQAFAEWSEASGGKVTCKFIEDPDAALITCRWTDKPSDLVDPGEDGQAMPSPSTRGEMSTAQIQLLTHNPRRDEVETDKYIHQVCLHEVGHVLGLLGHSTQPGDSMFSALSTGTATGVLSERDKKTLRMLYEAPESLIASHPLIADKVGFIGHESSPQNRAVKLNLEAVKEAAEGNFAKAIAKYEEALKLAPNMDFLYLNMGTAYGSMGNADLKARNLTGADHNFNKAVECFIKGKRKEIAVKVYDTLIAIAKSQNKQVDVQKYETLKAAVAPKN